MIEFYTQVNRECDDNNSRAVYEWMRNAPCFDEYNKKAFRMYKENGQNVCFIRPISPWQGEAVIDNLNASEETLHNVIKYAEQTYRVEQDDHKFLFLVSCDVGGKLDTILQEEGYEKVTVDHVMLQYDLSQGTKAINLPEGFHLHSISEVFDFDKLDDLIWKSFSYKGDVPKIDDEVNLTHKHAWLNLNRKVSSVVLDQKGEYASFCAFWYDNETQTAYLEPMVTREAYRNMGLGKAVVYNSLKRLQELGCKKVFVDPDDEPYDYYVKIGVRKFDHAKFYQKSFK